MMSGSWKGATPSSIFKWNLHRDSSLNTGLLDHVPQEIELSDYQRLPSSGSESPSGLLNGEGFKIDPIADLDIFFERVYNYYCEKGLWCIIVKWIVELLSVGFTICFSGFFLLFVDWNGLRNAKCGIDAVESGSKPCDLAKEALHSHPLAPFTFSKGIIVGYLGIFTVYWLFCFLRFFAQLKDTLEIRNFYNNCLDITDREVQTTPWPEILEKIVQVQHSQKLCVVKDLSAHDVVMRIMRKENYLIGLLNKGILSFPISQWVPGAGPAVNSGTNGTKYHLILPKTLEWTLNWSILHTMFDRNYCIRRDFISNPSSLKKRLMTLGVGMLLLSPFLVIFMLVYLFLRHAEQFYNHPSTASSRRWSNLSRWIFREFNELDHLFKHRINNSVVHASDYLKQFPSPFVSLVAKFISFVSGGFAAILIIIGFLDESLLEGQIAGRNLFWYAAVFGTVTAISRAAVTDDLQVLDPEGAMSLVVQHTHYMPKRWRGKEHTDNVRMEFETLFQYTGMMLLEEMTSIFLTPYLLLFVVPKHVDDIIQFISDFTVDVEGVGHVCSFSTFDFENHGNSKYGSPFNAPPDKRSSQGKLEKSFLSFHNVYPYWEPSPLGRQFLYNLCNFKAQQTSHEVQQVYSPNHPFHWKGQTEATRRFPSREVTNNIGAAPRPAYNMGSLWLINPEQRAHPYLLDWYYVLQPAPVIEEQGVSSRLQSETHVEVKDDLWPRYGHEKIDIKVDENTGFSLLDRSHSHLGASTSGPFFRESIFRHHGSGQPEDPTDSHWWRRSGSHLTGPETSFLEPPNFGYENLAHHLDCVSDKSVEEEEDNESIDLRKSQTLSRTRYVDYFENEEAFSLPFNDIYTGPLKNLPFNSNTDIP